MKNLNRHLIEVKRKMGHASDCVLMFDFDGTLSPIADTPEKAALPRKTKILLTECSMFSHLVIISGRPLADIKKKVGIDGLTYAGSHGLEWQIGKRVGHFRVPEKILRILVSAKKKLEKVLPAFPGMIIEDKRFTLAIHYRRVKPSRVGELKRNVMEAISPFLGDDLNLIKGKKVLELRPAIDWTKGHFAEFIVRHLEHDRGKRLTPFYMGDDITDEDVFSRFPDAVTIRVGKKAGSAAHYYLGTQAQVDSFLEWMLKEILRRPMPKNHPSQTGILE